MIAFVDLAVSARRVLAGLALLLAAGGALAQSWPSKPIRLIVGLAPVSTIGFFDVVVVASGVRSATPQRNARGDGNRAIPVESH